MTRARDLAAFVSNADGDIKFDTDTLFIDSSANKVGIGTTTPKESLNSGPIIVEGDHATGVNAMGSSAGMLLHATGDTGFVTATSNGSDNRNLQLRALNSGSANANQLFLSYLGRVGVGTSAPDTPLHVEGASGSQFVVEATSGQFAQQDFKIAGAQKGAIWTDDGTDLMGYYVGSGWGNNFYTNGSEVLRMTAAGKIRIGDAQTQAITYTGANVLMTEFGSNFGDNHAVFSCGNYTGAYTQLVFRNGNNIVGTIITENSATSYNTSSDYRLKENVTDVTDGITRVKQLAPKRFNFIADADTTVDGFLAHEAATVVPEAVTGTKDAMKDEEYTVTAAKGDVYTPATDDADEVVHSSNVEQPDTLEDGKRWRETSEAVMGTRSVPDMQGIDQSKLVPLLTAALQEAIAKIETLETQNTTQATQIADLITRVEALEAE